MFNKTDRNTLNNIAKVLEKNKNLLLKKENLEDKVSSLEGEIKDLQEKKESFKFTDGMYQGKVFIMRTPLKENSPMMYLHEYSEGRFGGYHWTSDVKKAAQYSFREAYQIKNNFCAFGDTKENLLIVCVDNIEDTEDFKQNKSELLRKDGFTKKKTRKPRKVKKA